MVRASPLRLSRCARRVLAVTDKKPSKVKRPAGRPDRASAETSAAGPGTVSTATPFSAHRRTMSSPGSEMAGIPASVTSAHFSPAAMRWNIFSPLANLLCS